MKREENTAACFFCPNFSSRCTPLELGRTFFKSRREETQIEWSYLRKGGVKFRVLGPVSTMYHHSEPRTFPRAGLHFQGDQAIPLIIPDLHLAIKRRVITPRSWPNVIGPSSSVR